MSESVPLFSEVWLGRGCLQFSLFFKRVSDANLCESFRLPEGHLDPSGPQLQRESDIESKNGPKLTPFSNAIAT